jgi:hypothetical protein
MHPYVVFGAVPGQEYLQEPLYNTLECEEVIGKYRLVGGRKCRWKYPRQVIMQEGGTAAPVTDDKNRWNIGIDFRLMPPEIPLIKVSQHIDDPGYQPGPPVPLPVFWIGFIFPLQAT